jgi:hypothetical protein
MFRSVILTWGTMLILLVAAGPTVQAFPTQGVVAPTAEVLPARTYELQVQRQGIQVMQSREYRHVTGLQFGLGSGVEVGMDHRVGPPRRLVEFRGQRHWDLQYDPSVTGHDTMWFNFKKLLVNETTRRPALAGGMLNIGGEAGTGSYMVAGKQMGAYYLYLGWADLLAGNRPMYDPTYFYEGIIYQPEDDWKLMVEHISRGRFSTNLAIEHRVSDKVAITLGFMRSNNVIFSDYTLMRLSYQDAW